MSYKTDPITKQVQKYLPPKYRLNNRTNPEEYFITIDRYKIHIDHYKTTNPKATVVMFHGVGGNGRLLSCMAIPLSKNGFEVICPDLPLYGYTEYEGKIDYQTWVCCGIEIVKYYQQTGCSDIFLFGLSAGGMLAYQVACEFKNISGILVSCILDQRDMEITKKTASNWLVAATGKPLMSILQKFIGDVKVPMKILGNMKAITNNKKLAKLLMHDKKSSGVSVPIRFVYSMLTPEIKTEPEQFHSCPFFLVHPGEDRWTDISLSRKFYDRLACEKEILILKGAGHFPIEESGLQQLETACVSFLNKHI
ncbi:alpha/beta hydrolase [Clostridiales bacterium COT073_COT-073]|nr:alpha/beta hydrolase [Clostridiales bacterium COT073_COT-073]